MGRKAKKDRNNVLEVAGLVGAGDGARAILEELALDFAAPVGEAETKVLLNLLRVPVSNHHRTWFCSDGQPLAMVCTCYICTMLYLWPHTQDHKTSKQTMPSKPTLTKRRRDQVGDSSSLPTGTRRTRILPCS